jgi:ribosomal protein S21
VNGSASTAAGAARAWSEQQQQQQDNEADTFNPLPLSSTFSDYLSDSATNEQLSAALGRLKDPVVQVQYPRHMREQRHREQQLKQQQRQQQQQKQKQLQMDDAPDAESAPVVIAKSPVKPKKQVVFEMPAVTMLASSSGAAAAAAAAAAAPQSSSPSPQKQSAVADDVAVHKPPVARRQFVMPTRTTALATPTARAAADLFHMLSMSAKQQQQQPQSQPQRQPPSASPASHDLIINVTPQQRPPMQWRGNSAEDVAAHYSTQY